EVTRHLRVPRKLRRHLLPAPLLKIPAHQIRVKRSKRAGADLERVGNTDTGDEEAVGAGLVEGREVEVADSLTDIIVADAARFDRGHVDADVADANGVVFADRHRPRQLEEEGRRLDQVPVAERHLNRARPAATGDGGDAGLGEIRVVGADDFEPAGVLGLYMV